MLTCFRAFADCCKEEKRRRTVFRGETLTGVSPRFRPMRLLSSSVRTKAVRRPRTIALTLINSGAIFSEKRARLERRFLRMPSSRPNSFPLLRTPSSHAPESVRERNRCRTLGPCALTLALALALAGSVSGCAWFGDEPSGPDAAARVTRLANFPEAGMEACLIPGEGYSPSWIWPCAERSTTGASRSTSRSRASPKPHQCRTTVTISAVSSKGFSELPEKLTLDFATPHGRSQTRGLEVRRGRGRQRLDARPFGTPNGSCATWSISSFPRPVALH